MGSGGIYPQAHKPLKVADKPAGQWNTSKSSSKRGSSAFISTASWCSTNSRASSANPIGPLVLQHHGTPLWFKNVYIKELK